MYTKFQLAQLYFPDLNDRSARRRLNRWIHQANGLQQELESTGYSPLQHSFSQKQVEIIYKYLGEP